MKPYTYISWFCLLVIGLGVLQGTGGNVWLAVAASAFALPVLLGLDVIIHKLKTV